MCSLWLTAVTAIACPGHIPVGDVLVQQGLTLHVLVHQVRHLQQQHAQQL